MKLELKDLKVGQRVWICDYRLKDIFNKPIRNVEPVLVEVRPMEEAKKTIYYSEIYFAKIDKNNNHKQDGYAPFDNTGFRGYTGVCVQIFDNDKEAKTHYNSERKKCILKKISVHENELKILTNELNNFT